MNDQRTRAADAAPVAPLNPTADQWAIAEAHGLAAYLTAATGHMPFPMPVAELMKLVGTAARLLYVLGAVADSAENADVEEVSRPLHFWAFGGDSAATAASSYLTECALALTAFLAEEDGHDANSILNVDRSQVVDPPEVALLETVNAIRDRGGVTDVEIWRNVVEVLSELVDTAEGAQ